MANITIWCGIQYTIGHMTCGTATFIEHFCADRDFRTFEIELQDIQLPGNSHDRFESQFDPEISNHKIRSISYAVHRTSDHQVVIKFETPSVF